MEKYLIIPQWENALIYKGCAFVGVSLAHWRSALTRCVIIWVLRRASWMTSYCNQTILDLIYTKSSVLTYVSFGKTNTQYMSDHPPASKNHFSMNIALLSNHSRHHRGNCPFITFLLKNRWGCMKTLLRYPLPSLHSQCSTPFPILHQDAEIIIHHSPINQSENFFPLIISAL